MGVLVCFLYAASPRPLHFHLLCGAPYASLLSAWLGCGEERHACGEERLDPGFCAFRARTRLCSNLAARAVFLTRSHFLMHWFSGSAHWNFNSRFVKLGPLPVTAVSFSPLFRFYSNSLNSFLHDDPASSNGLGAMCRQLCGSLWRFLGDYTVDVELFLQTVFWCFFWAVFPFSKVLSCSARWKLQQTDRPNWACSWWHYSFFLFFFSHEVRKRIPFRNGSTLSWI